MYYRFPYAVGGMFASIQSSYYELSAHSVITFGNETLERWLGLEDIMRSHDHEWVFVLLYKREISLCTYKERAFENIIKPERIYCPLTQDQICRPQSCERQILVFYKSAGLWYFIIAAPINKGTRLSHVQNILLHGRDENTFGLLSFSLISLYSLPQL